MGRVVGGVMAMLWVATATCAGGETQREGAAQQATEDQGSREAFAEKASGKRPAANQFVVWNQVAKLSASDATTDDGFGNTVSVDGNTALVGALTFSGDSRPGAVYVFVNAAGTWSQQAKLMAPDALPDDGFGSSVSVSGNTAVIGKPWGTVNGNLLQGIAYVFVNSGGAWSQQAELTALDGSALSQFGTSVSISGDTIVVGSNGAAYVFSRDARTWTQQAELTALDELPADNFGFAVAVGGNIIVVGAPYKYVSEHPFEGAAYVFAEAGGTWTQQAELVAWNSFNTYASDEFGTTVATDGNLIVVGAPKTPWMTNLSSTVGAVYLFAQSNGTWTQQARLMDPFGLLFGRSVAVSDGVAIAGFANGAADILGVSDSTWVAEAQLTTTGGAGAEFGQSVSVSGTTAIVGAPHAAVGNAYVFVGSMTTQASQTIDFPALPNVPFPGNGILGLSATASSGLPVTFSAIGGATPFSRQGVCRVSGNAVTLLGLGTCTIQATQAGNPEYAAATPVTQSFQVTPGSETILFGPLPNQTLGTKRVAISATATSGLRVGFASTTQSVCTVSRSMSDGGRSVAWVNLLATGACTIEAAQPGNPDYAAATPVSESFQVTP